MLLRLGMAGRGSLVWVARVNAPEGSIRLPE